jgi:hypothetical protein
VVVDPPGQATRVMAWGAPLPAVLMAAALLGAILGAVGAVLRAVFLDPVRDRPDGTGPRLSAASEHQGEG